MRGNGVRGGLGVRGSMGSRGAASGSGIRGSSSYSGGVRTGAHGYKVQSKTSSFSDYGSSSFRSSHFGHSPNTQIRPGHPMVVLAAATPILYDNRNYYWSYSLARSENNVSNPTVICEYVFGEDDGELQHVTYSNGTQIKSIFFECSGRVNCCGMYCCHDFGQWWEMLFVLGFIGVIVFIAAYAKRHEKEGPTPVSRKKKKQNIKKKKKENPVELEELASTVAKSVPPDLTPTRQLEQIIEE
ncbi:hypothetical protein B9Z55_020673 [Caenorhabditis nigoni]|nr:hypothetical protein B9Z55_020673 [Caenorhabditis nigoni]